MLCFSIIPKVVDEGVHMPSFKIIAHRGHGPTSDKTGGPSGQLPPDVQPENTMEAFQYAIESGANAIELDVYISSDGIPMVIHDDDLNINVYQADRKTRELGKVSEKTQAELQNTALYPLGPNQERIPTLQELIDYIANVNESRTPDNRVMLDIELKGEHSATNTWHLVRENIQHGKLQPDDVVYCSFDYNELRTIRTLDKNDQASDVNSKIAPCIKTALLYGEENVIKPGWWVPFDKQILDEGLSKLQELHDEIGCCAMDAILWDIEYPLIELVIRNGIELHASTSNFRPDGTNLAFMQMLYRISKEIDVYFKTDEPKSVLTWLKQMQHEETIVNLSAENASQGSSPDELNMDFFDDVSISSITIIETGPLADLKRLIKPGYEQEMKNSHISILK